MNDAAHETPPRDPAFARAPDEYAIVEVFGHRRHGGRVSEVERFGTKMLRIDIPKPDAAAAPGDPFAGAAYESHYYGGGSIFSLTPVTLDIVKQMNAPYRPALPYTRDSAARDGMIRGDETPPALLDEQTWKQRFKDALKARMTGDDWTDEDREREAAAAAEASWPDYGGEPPEEVAASEAAEMARE